mmetsp:Transcript_164/g.364  ORF Transcript_164/g.364 Transcript_164/m.364 type:complete len:1262 (-) Transcript_164:6-3791(-)
MAESDSSGLPSDSETELSEEDDFRGEGRLLDIWGYTERKQRLLILLGMALAAVQGCLVPLMAVLTSKSITALTTAEPGKIVEAMMPVIINIGELAIAEFLLTLAWQKALIAGSSRQAMQLQIRYVRSLLGYDIAWFDAHEPAGMATNLTAEVATLHAFMSYGLGYLASSAAEFFAGVSIAVYSCWQLTLVVGALLPFLVIAGALIGRQIERSFSGQQADFARAANIAEEALLAVRTVVCFGMEAKSIQSFEHELTAAKRAGIKANIKIGFTWGFMNFLFACIYALTFWYGGHFLVAGSNFTGGHVITVLLALIMGLSGLSQFSGFTPKMAKAAVAAKSMADVMHCKTQDIENEQDLQSQKQLPHIPAIELIEFKSVCFRYPTRPDTTVLQDLSLSIRKGQKVAFVGESGSGKSTTIQLIERFYDPSAGEIYINGMPLVSLPVRAWRKQIGYVGQEPVLFAASVLANIKAGEPSMTDDQAMEAARLAGILNFLLTLPDKLETFVGATGGQMSGGQKQRLAIARALAKKPQVLLLDEATSSLDSVSEQTVQSCLDGLHDKLGNSVTTISVAHRLTTIMGYDRIYVLKNGRCCEQGSHNELMMMRGEYFSLAAAQQSAAFEGDDAELLPTGGTTRRSQSSRMDTPNSQSYSRAPTLTSGHSLTSSLAQAADAFGFNPEGEETEQQGGVTARLFVLARPECAIFPLAFLSILLAAILVPFEAYFFNNALGSFYYKDDQEMMLQQIDHASLALVICGLISFVSEVGKNGLFGYIQECLCMRLRKLAFQSIIRREIAFFDGEENQTASLLTALERHMTRVSQMLGQNFANSITAALVCLSSIIFSFVGSYQLALALLGFVLLAATVSGWTAAWAHRPSKPAEQAFAVAGFATTEAVTQIRTVRALGAEEHCLQVVTDSLDTVALHERNAEWKRAFSLGLSNALVELVFLGGFWLSAWLVESGGLDSQKVLLTLFCIVFGLMSASTISAYLPEAATGHHAAAEAFRLIDQESSIDAIDSHGHRDFKDGSITFKDVQFSYPSRPDVKVLRGISFTVLPGQAVALVGFSGSGKSTVIQLLQRFYDHPAGSIQVGGVDLRMFDIAWWRKQLGVVAQEPVLFDTSLEENVKYGCPEATLAEVKEAARLANMDYAFNGAVSWSERLGFHGEKLSGGQRQRCAIARAILRKPRILLLDEATSALDSTSESLIQQALQNVRGGRTVITVAHRLSTIRSSDQIFVMSSGQIRERGTYEELLKLGGLFANLAKSAER